MQNENTSIVSKVKEISKDIKDISGFGEGLCDACAMGFYDKGYRKQHWISVKDRLPETRKRVLVFIKKPANYTSIDTDRMVDDKWVRWGRYVTHWMPLPEPPKGD